MNDKWDIMTRLTRAIAGTPAQLTLPERLGQVSADILGARGVSVTTGSVRARTLLCVTDDRAAELSHLQCVSGEGPELDAYRHGRSVHADFTSTPNSRWTDLAGRIQSAIGSISVHSYPFQYGHGRSGVFTAHFSPGDRIAEDDVTAQFLADAVGLALIQHVADNPDPVSTWDGELLIRHATRLILEQLPVSADDALALLHAHAYTHDTTIAAVSTELVERRLDFLSAHS